MARQDLAQSPDFRLDLSWPPTPTGGGIPLPDASVGRLSISIQDTPVTAYQSDKGDIGVELTLPLYSLAEWITSNWWPLLYEPRKTDFERKGEFDGDEDYGFRSRHWLGFARSGFALPDLWFLPAGDEIDLVAYGRYLRHARLTFVNSATASAPTEDVRNALFLFVEDVLAKLSSQGFGDTAAHENWENVCNTSEDEEGYCRLIGSLGLSPYEQHEQVDRIIDVLTGHTPASLLTDLCQVSDDNTLPSLARLTEQVYALLPKTREINIEPLAHIELLPRSGLPPWQLGKQAAKRARASFGIAAQDAEGGNAFFEKLGIDPSEPDVAGLEGSAAARLSGGMKRDDRIMHMALGEPQLPRRRFAAARAVFLGWACGDHSSRLITGARTRDQQMSRAFAAELLAPIDYIRRHAGGPAISMFRVEEIATDLGVSPAVVRWQARDNNLHVVDTASW
jgi:hypothetical protein